jgi:hypothetical protein
MGSVTRRQRAALPAALGVVAVLAALAYGLPAVDRALPSERPVTPGRPYVIGADVTVIPPRGAVLDVSGTRQGDADGSVLFRIGPVRYSIVVRPFDGTLEAAATSLRRRITATSGYQITGGQLDIKTSQNLSGLQGGYAGPGQGGRYAVFLAGGHTIEVTVTGAELDLGRTLPAVDASTRTLDPS